MFLDKLVVLVSLFDSGILIFLLSLAHNTTSLHNIIIDVPLDRLAHACNFFLRAWFDFSLDFFASCFLISKTFLLSFIQAVTDNILRFKISKRDFFRFDKIFHTLSELWSGLVSVSSICEIILCLFWGPFNYIVDRSEVIVEIFKFILHVFQLSIAHSLALLLCHLHTPKVFKLIFLNHFCMLVCFRTLIYAHVDLFGFISDFFHKLLHQVRFA